MRLQGLRAAAAVALATPLLLAAGKNPDRPAIEEIATRVESGRVIASFRLARCLSAETVERIHSGIAVGFRHKLELIGPRPFLLTPRRLEARTIVETSVEYDPLIKRYTLERVIQVKSKEKRRTPEPQRVRRVTESEAEMRSFMTEVQDIPLYDPGRTLSGRLKLKIHSNVGRRYVMMIFPGNLTVSAERVLEFDGTP